MLPIVFHSARRMAPLLILLVLALALGAEVANQPHPDPHHPLPAASALVAERLELAEAADPPEPGQPADPPESAEPEPPDAPELPEHHPASVGIDSPLLAALLEEHWDWLMERAPTWATDLGDRRFDDRLGDPSAAAREAARIDRLTFLARAEVLIRQDLSPSDHLTAQLFIHEQKDDLAADTCRFWAWSLSPRSNPVVDLNRLPDGYHVRDAADVRNLLQRYRAIPRVVDARIANLRQGLAENRVANAETLRRTLEQVRSVLATPLPESTLLDIDFPGDFDAAARDALLAEAQAIIAADVLPAYGRFERLVADELLPAGRPAALAGLTGLPDGDACYAHLVRHFTTLDQTAEQVHQRGLREMEGIHAEFRALGSKVFGTDDLATIFATLRSDESLKFETAEQIRATAEAALARAKAGMGKAFGRLPQADCIVRPIPDYEAPYTTIAYYRGPNPDGSKPGEYFVNKYAPGTRPRPTAEVLAFHEAIPGHHLQIAIAQELPALPAFRRYGGFTAFVEGWALYTERLADEMGLYSGDIDRLGMLTFDAWRAGRLVVDTGVHAKGWTREQAKDYLQTNTPLALNNIDNEVDRYISWPGQAIAYKTGQLELRALRAEARQALGERFDLAAFHDVVLGGGALPLPLLRERVQAWIESSRAS